MDFVSSNLMTTGMPMMPVKCNGRDLLGERVSVEIARGTPHGRDREKWGGGRGGGRDDRRGGGRDDRRGRDGGRNRPVWLDKYGPPTRTDFRVVVENLSSRVSWQDLKDYMRQAGEVTYAGAQNRGEMKDALNLLLNGI